MTFANPLYFLLLLPVVLFVLWHFLLSRKYEHSITVYSTEPYRRQPRTLRTSLIHLPFVLRVAVYVLVVVCLARPQTHNALRESETEGIDIMMAMDISVSMLTPDFSPNRMEAAKEVAYEFISNRPHDNIGLTLFGGEAFTQCPLTTDHAALLSMFRNVNCGLQQANIIADGTAIGMGIAASVSHLQQSKAKSKVIILLTDGENNTGEISPLTAAEMASKLGIRIYTISLGTDAVVDQAVATLPNGEIYTTPLKAASDPETLQKIAAETGGHFYKARSLRKLREIYSDIDKLEKTKLKVINHDKRYDAYQPFALAALLCLLFELLLRLTWFRRIP